MGPEFVSFHAGERASLDAASRAPVLERVCVAYGTKFAEEDISAFAHNVLLRTDQARCLKRDSMQFTGRLLHI